MQSSKIQVTKLHAFTGHRDCVYTLQPADDPHLFFSGAGDGMVVLWNLKEKGDGELIAQLANSVYSLLHLMNEKLLVAGQNYSGIHLIDYQNKKEIASMQLTSSAIFDIQSFANDLIIATGDGMITIVDLEKWVVKKRIAPTEKSARAIALNKVSGEIAVGFSDNIIRVFGLSDYHLKQEINAHENSVFALSYSPDGKFLFSGSRDARLKVWDVLSNYNLTEEVVAHMYTINHIVFSPDGKNFATCSMDKSIKIWNLEDLKLLKVIDKGRHAGHGTSVNKLLWTLFNNQLASASDDRSISVWDLLFL
ncbi:MAG: WD40 repeat domain-containing protein [Bacteroidetes bacterium]|nr:WD40 repeat domain-containing protein [Bacteroidota bacterium]